MSAYKTLSEICTNAAPGTTHVTVNIDDLILVLIEFDVLATDQQVKKTRARKEAKPTIEPYPNWLPHDAWNAFLDMRKKIKKPATEYAQKLLLKKLAAFYANDLDPGVILNQSIMNGWQDLYAPKEQSTAYRSNGRPSVADQNRENNAEAMRLLSLPTFADDGRTLEMEP